MNKLLLFIPELYYLLVVAVFFLLAILPRPNPRRDYFTAVTLAAAGVLISLACVPLQGQLFFGAYRLDLFSQVFKAILAAGLFLNVCLCVELRGIGAGNHPEFYLLLTLCTLAMMMLVSSVEMLTLYLALELSSYSLYLLVALRRGSSLAVEAAIKYFLVGVSASAIMLFGFASLYGVVHTTYLEEILRVLPGLLSSPAAVIGLLLTLCGLFFKLALFPLHIWAPDVYQGAANQVSAYIATASKVAAVAVVMRLVSLAGDHHSALVEVLIGLSICSMTLGNLVAIAQKDLKRLLAYSSISQAGYVLIGILCLSPRGYASAIFYAVAYMLMTFTCFLVVVKAAWDGGNLRISQLAGLHRRAPILALALFVGVFALAGIPPTIGFTGKFLLFSAAMEKGYFLLVLIAMINVVISLYYYMLVVRAAYLLEPDGELSRLVLSFPTRVLTGVMVVALVLLGLCPQLLLELAQAAARSLL